MVRKQRTIKSRVEFEGIGLHSGKSVSMRIVPATADAGIVFVRTDLGGAKVEAAASNTGSVHGCATTLHKNGVVIQTVEHLLAALAGLNIDNALIEIDSEEVPIMDGSAAFFVRRLADAGMQVLERSKPMLKIVKPVIVRDGNKQVAIWAVGNPEHLLFYRLQSSHAQRPGPQLPVLGGELPARGFGCAHVRVPER